MAKRGGFPGGMPGNMNNLMKQAQRMQRQMEETTKELEAKVTAVKISPEAVDPDDVEMLEDLIMAATNEAFRQLEEANNNAMSKLTGGMGGLGGGFPF